MCFSSLVRTLIVVLCLLTFDLLADDKTEQMNDVLALVEKVEPYSRFLAAEEKAIKDKKQKYLQARNGYLYTLRYEEARLEESPKKPLEVFMNFIHEKDLWFDKGDKKEFEQAAYLLGMELIVGRPAFDVSLNKAIKISDITYARYDNINLKLDLFLPKKTSGEPVPCIICVHGGGLYVNKRAWYHGFAAYFANHGYAAISIDYRKFPGITSPISCIQDAKTSVRWIRANAKKYNIDPNKIGAMGGSAGANLVAMLATTPGVNELEGDGGYKEFSSTIQAAVCFAIQSMKPETKYSRVFLDHIKKQGISNQLVSPYLNINKHSAPTFFLHGTNDPFLPTQSSEEMHEKYKKSGASSRLKLLEGKGHVFYTNVETSQWAFEYFQSIFEN